MGGLFTDGNPRMEKRIKQTRQCRRNTIMVKERVLDFANHINRPKRERRVPLRKRIPNTGFLNRLYRTKWPIWECSLNYASRKAPTRLPRLRVSRSNGYQNCWPKTAGLFPVGMGLMRVIPMLSPLLRKQESACLSEKREKKSGMIQNRF